MIKFHCKYCNKKVGAKDHHAGKHLKCPQCQKKILVPSPEPQDKTYVLQKLLEEEQTQPKLNTSTLDLKKEGKKQCPCCKNIILEKSVICNLCGEVLNKQGIKSRKDTESGRPSPDDFGKFFSHEYYFSCSHCGQTLSAHRKHAGYGGKCPKCNEAFTIPPPPIYDPNNNEHYIFHCPWCKNIQGAFGYQGGTPRPCGICNQAYLIPSLEQCKGFEHLEEVEEVEEGVGFLGKVATTIFGIAAVGIGTMIIANKLDKDNK